jgi:hypothetical protein
MTVEGTEVGAMEPETEMDAIEPLNPLHMRGICARSTFRSICKSVSKVDLSFWSHYHRALKWISSYQWLLQAVGSHHKIGRLQELFSSRLFDKFWW